MVTRQKVGGTMPRLLEHKRKVTTQKVVEANKRHRPIFTGEPQTRPETTSSKAGRRMGGEAAKLQ